MKNNTLFTIAFLLLSLTGYSQEAPETQSVLITKIAASWCPPCGGWGWTTFHDLIADNDDKATLLAIHHSGNLLTPTSGAFAENLDPPYQPWFFVNNTDQDINNANSASKRIEIKNQVDMAADASPIVNTGILATTDNNEITVTTKTKFFQDADANYFLGVYLVEDGRVSFQSGQGNDAVHEQLLVTKFTATTFGEQLSSGSVSANTEMEHSFTLAIDPAWNLENLEIATIIWKEENGVYLYENSNDSDEIAVVTNTDNISEAVFDLSVEPTVLSDRSTINFETYDNDFVKINIFDQAGRLVTPVFDGNLAAGRHGYTVERSDLAAAGLYYVRIETAAGISTAEMVVQ